MDLQGSPTHSSVDDHLGYFHFLPIVNNVAVNIGIHVSFQSMVFSGSVPRSDCWVFIFIFFKCIYFLIRRWLLYNIVLVSALHRHELAIGIHMSPLSSSWLKVSIFYFIMILSFSFWKRAWQPHPVFCLENPDRQRSLVGYSPWGCKESETTERLSTIQNIFQFIGEVILHYK